MLPSEPPIQILPGEAPRSRGLILQPAERPEALGRVDHRVQPARTGAGRGAASEQVREGELAQERIVFGEEGVRELHGELRRVGALNESLQRFPLLALAIIKSPVGMPGRAIHNEFLKNLPEEGKVKVRCPYRCLTACKVDKARYCIAKALLNSFMGDVTDGLIFCGQNAYRVDKIISVKELVDELLDGVRAN